MADKKNITKKIKSILDNVRPMLQQHGGDVEFIDFDAKTRVVKVRLQGQCVGCPMAQVTLKQGIEDSLKKEVGEVKEVVAVQ